MRKLDLGISAFGIIAKSWTSTDFCFMSRTCIAFLLRGKGPFGPFVYRW